MPQTGVQSEVGLKYQPTGLNARFGVALFDLKRRNALTTDPNNPQLTICPSEHRPGLGAWLARWPLDLSFAAVTAPAPGPATGTMQRSITFAIPPQSLATGIVAFSRAAGVDLVFDGAVPSGARTSGVSGTLTVRDGVNRLLAGTGQTARLTGARTVQIVNLQRLVPLARCRLARLRSTRECRVRTHWAKLRLCCQ